MITSEITPAAYQLVPLSKLACNGLNGLLIADGVGLGKTISATYIAVYFSEMFKLPTGVICSPVLVTKWLTELRSKFKVSAFAVRSPEDMATAMHEAKLRPSNFYVISNSLLASNSEIEHPAFGTLVIDEIQYFRNKRTKSYATALKLALQSRLRVGLSATPINNTLDDLSSELAVLLAEENWDAVSALVSDLWSWKKTRITTPLVTRFAKDKLGMNFARRHVQLLDVKFPEDFRNTVARTLERTYHSANIYEVVTYLRMAASCPSLFITKFHLDGTLRFEDQKPRIVRTVLEGSNISHWLVFVEFEGTARFLASVIEDRPVFVITGRTPIFERDDIIESFKESDAGILILTPVGSEGLDLQFCQGVINYDLHWNPMKIEQRIGRIDRIGQSKNQIEIVNIRVLGSIDDRVLQVILNKLDLTERSIFAPGEILLPSKVKAGSVQRRAVESELDQSKQLISAIRYTGYCSASELREAAGRAPLECLWLTQDETSFKWQEKIRTEASQFQAALESYK